MCIREVSKYFYTTTIITQNLLDMRKLFVLICAVAICLTAQAQKTKKGLTTQNPKLSPPNAKKQADALARIQILEESLANLG